MFSTGCGVAKIVKTWLFLPATFQTRKGSWNSVLKCSTRSACRSSRRPFWDFWSIMSLKYDRGVQKGLRAHQEEAVLSGEFQEGFLEEVTFGLGLHKWVGFFQCRNNGKGHPGLRGSWKLWGVCRFGTPSGLIQILALPLFESVTVGRVVDISEPVPHLQS